MNVRAWSVLISVAAATLAGCGGGGSASPGPRTEPTPAPVSLPSQPRSYAGTRIIDAVGPAIAGVPAPGTYAVSAIEQDLVPGAGAPAGAAIDRHAVRTFSGTVPPTGIYLQSQTIDLYGRFTGAGLELAGTSLTTVGRDIGAESHTPGTQQVDTRVVTVTYPGGAVVIPGAVANAALAFPRASTSRTTDSLISTNGVLSANGGAGLDITRTTNADGSFDEGGFFSDVGVHAIHQHADGSATSHDQIAGFMLRDVAVSAPAGLGAAASLAVTTQTQGRTVGSPPIVTTQYQTPVWYAGNGLGNNVLSQSVNVSLPAECALGAASAARLVVLSLYHVDVTTGVSVKEDDDNYVDANGVTLCRKTQAQFVQFDVTTGARIGSAGDTTVLHLVAMPSTGVTVSFGAQRRTKEVSAGR